MSQPSGWCVRTLWAVPHPDVLGCRPPRAGTAVAALPGPAQTLGLSSIAVQNRIRVMIVDEDAERAARIEQGLVESGYEVVTRLIGHADLQAHVNAVQPDVIIIDMES